MIVFKLKIGWEFSEEQKNYQKTRTDSRKKLEKLESKKWKWKKNPNSYEVEINENPTRSDYPEMCTTFDRLTSLAYIAENKVKLAALKFYADNTLNWVQGIEKRQEASGTSQVDEQR